MVITVQKLRGKDFMPGFSIEIGGFFIKDFVFPFCEVQKKEK